MTFVECFKSVEDKRVWKIAEKFCWRVQITYLFLFISLFMTSRFFFLFFKCISLPSPPLRTLHYQLRPFFRFSSKKNVCKHRILRRESVWYLISQICKSYHSQFWLSFIYQRLYFITVSFILIYHDKIF